MRELLKNKARKYLRKAIGRKSEYWFGYEQAIFDLFPELEEEKSNMYKEK
jgi:hypothetical protein